MVVRLALIRWWYREVPEIVSQADMIKFSFEEYARANFNMNKRKSAISLRRQKSFSTQQICAYSKVRYLLTNYLTL
jgi:CRISPR/Cas system CMR-associated protein Cmr1 (group 7 of RAMP superfamily)